MQPESTLSRRQFLKSSALAAIAALLSRRTHASVSGRSVSKVIVIGAGASGLAAARALADENISVTVLEARNRIGGRIWTDRSLGLPIDLGASWIHKSAGNPVTPLAKKFKAKFVKTNYASSATYDPTGKALDAATVGRYDDNYKQQFNAVLAQQDSLRSDISLAEAFANAAKGKNFTADELLALDWQTSTELIGEYAAELESLGLEAFDSDEEFSGVDQFNVAGYDKFTDGLAKGLDIRLNEIVQRVDYGSSVTVTTSGGSFTADACVVTVPLGVLKARSIVFNPALPAQKIASIDAMEMGVLNKLVLTFPKAFWPTKVDFLEFIPPTHNVFPEWINLAHYTKKPVLVATNCGSYGVSLEKLTDNEIAALGMEVLKRAFGSSIPSPTGILAARWKSDPFAFGSYSCWPVGSGQKDNKALAEPIGGKLFFAGEATNELYPATVHGAYLSGVREAERILAL